MALATYTDLQASIAAWLFNRSDLSGVIPDFIRLAEVQMEAEVRHRQMAAKISLTLAGELTDLPADFRGPITLANSTQVIPFASLEQMAEDRLVNTDTCRRHYSILGSQLQVWPAPANGDTATLVYYQAIPPLATNATNWLLTRFPNAYLYGALLQAAPYLMNSAMAPIWQGAYASALQMISDSDLAEKMRAPTIRSANNVV